MVKEVFFFTEMAYTEYPRDEAAKYGFTNFLFPNSNFEPVKASALYQMYLDEYQQASEAGFDGGMTNEHHYAPFCMQTCTNIVNTALVHVMKRGKIVCLGNPIPLHENPVRVAEELAMIDLMSKGRVVSGFIRGGGQESLASNANPSYNRERFREGLDLIIKTWTTPGPFRWEGKHYQIRVVNPWMLPMQKPHPPIWIPGLSSPETIRLAAEYQFPYITLGTGMEASQEIRQMYHQYAKEVGFTPTSDHLGCIIRICVQDTDEQGYEAGKHFYWQRGSFTGVGRPEWSGPPGYASKAVGAATIRKATAGLGAQYDEANKILSMVTGSPKTVVEKLKQIVDRVDPAYMVFWAREGPMSHDAAARCIELLGQEVIPAIKEHKAQLGQ